MKKILPVLILSLLTFIFFQNQGFSNKAGAGAGVANSPFDGGSSCANTTCHGGTLNSGPGSASITSDIPGAGYSPGVTYTVTASVTESPKVRFGFQVLPGYDVDGSVQVGTTTLISTTETQKKVSGAGNQYVTHLFAGTSGTNSRSWTFSWTAPSVGAGDVGFYGTFNAANNNGGKTGDKIYSSSLVVSQIAVGLEPENEVVTVKIFPTLCSGDLMIDAYGVEISEIGVRDISGKEVYLHDFGGFGYRNEVIDVSGWRNGYYFVSVMTAKGIESRKVLKY